MAFTNIAYSIVQQRFAGVSFWKATHRSVTAVISRVRLYECQYCTSTDSGSAIIHTDKAAVLPVRESFQQDS